MNDDIRSRLRGNRPNVPQLPSSPPQSVQHRPLHMPPQRPFTAQQPSPSQPGQQPFQPPTAVAEQEEQQFETSTAGSLIKPKRSFKERLSRMSKKQWMLISIAATLVLGGGSASAYYLVLRDKPQPATAQKQTKKTAPSEPAKPTTVASTLTGLQIDPAYNERPVTAIMIENSPDARPQSGLDRAGVIFEAVAEGGITRFLTLYQEAQPEYIGPVRSVRPYYVQWAMGFDAPIAHVGGSADALNYIKQANVKDLDQFVGGAFFWRISSRTAPHNMYTSMAKLDEYKAQKGYGKSVYDGFVRKSKEEPHATPTARTIDFNISGALYNAHFDYDSATNTYKRSVGGAAHMVVDQAGAQTQLAPKVVIALVMPQGLDGKYTTYNTIGTGQMILFQDGVALPGTWRKDSNKTNFVFTDANGVQLKLNSGQTWLTALGGPERVTYAP